MFDNESSYNVAVVLLKQTFKLLDVFEIILALTRGDVHENVHQVGRIIT